MCCENEFFLKILNERGIIMKEKKNVNDMGKLGLSLK